MSDEFKEELKKSMVNESMFKIGSIVQICYDNGDDKEFGVILNKNGTKDYPDDFWIRLSNGKEVPYGEDELSLSSLEKLKTHITQLEALIELSRILKLGDKK